MKTKRYKILVLVDLKNSTQNTLKNTIGLAEMLNAEIELFHVRKPTDVVEQENQLAAMRTLNRRHVTTARKIQNLVNKLSANNKVDINTSFSFGNVKAEIEKHINNYKPDIVVLGKRKKKTLNITGDNITDFVIKSFKGSILIASDRTILDPDKGLSLGLVNDSGISFGMNFAQELMGYSKAPLRSFKIAEGSGNTGYNENSTTEGTVEFVFDKNDNAVKNLTKYLLKSNINLAYLNRGKPGTGRKDNLMLDIIGNVEIPILLSGEQFN